MSFANEASRVSQSMANLYHLACQGYVRVIALVLKISVL